jgi:hypothetical protein
MRSLARAATLLFSVALAACQPAGPAPQAPPPGSLTIGVGGSVGMSGAAISQPRTSPRY